MIDTALVLFSGGQDSTLCLAHALTRYARVETLGFDYGQTHRVELDCRETLRDALRAHNPDWRDRLGDDHLLALPALTQIGGTALIEGGKIETAANGLPTSFVPGRNLLFLTYAAALAYRRDLNVLVGGMCEADYSGYPDCRRETLDALMGALNRGMETHLTLDTPLMFINKADTWRMGDALGLTELTIAHTHSCYLGDRKTQHAWGYGCGDCPACVLRARGFDEWQKT